MSTQPIVSKRDKKTNDHKEIAQKQKDDKEKFELGKKIMKNDNKNNKEIEKAI